jgi:quinol monooxygenase YgiN
MEVTMYARLGRFNMRPEQRAAVEEMAVGAKKMMSAAQGCVSVTLIINEANNTAGSFSVWESKALHDVYAAEVFPKVLEKLREVGVAPPYVEEFETLDL